MKGSEVLRKAQRVLADPAKWTKGAMSRVGGAAYGAVVAHGADCFCANGALSSLFPDDMMPLRESGASLWLSAAAKQMGFDNVTALNDHPRTTHADVMVLYYRARRLAKADERRKR